MTKALTDTCVRNLAAPAEGNRVLFDSKVAGFGARVTKAGARSFVLNFRTRAGRQRRVTIGSFPAWTVADAREEAAKLRQAVDRGEDPMQNRVELRGAPTVTDLAERYRKVHLPKKRPASAANDESALRKYVLPALGRLKVTDVRRSDVVKLHAKISAKAPIAANRVLALVSTMFNLAVREGLRGDNPTEHVERNPENKRDRYLTAAEISRLSAVLVEHPERAAANAVRLLLLTGARRSEVLGATWTQFDLAEGVWTKPATTTKQKRLHRIPLSAPALALLVEMQNEATPGVPFVFPSRTRDKQIRPLGSIKTAWATICQRAGLEDVHLHDVRHSYASILASRGASLPLIGALLGHTQAQTTQRYAHLIDTALRQATEGVGVFVTSAERPSAEVVPLPAAAERRS